ncbi:MAG: hypothetical protein Q9184_007774, partial [Pyrenodesmia sp. 2 TL-2023]
MTPQNTQASQTAQQPRLQVSAQPQNSTSSPRDPRENFAYDFGPSNSPTRPREGDAKSLDGSQISADPGDAPDPDQLRHQLEHTIFERDNKGTRARVPKGAKQADGVNAISNASAASQPANPATNGKEHKTSLLGVQAGAADDKSNAPSPPFRSDTGGKKHKNSLLGVRYGAADKRTTLRRVMLDWGNDERQGSDAQPYVLNATVEAPAAKVDSQNSVIWQHSDLEDIELDELNILVARMKDMGLEEDVAGLSKRLLNRVRLVTQREFVNGSFLTPKAMRYDMHDASRYGHNRCCIFVSFPYFAVNEAQERCLFKKGDARHPVRTLLQSRYRLNETVDKDESQCIRTVGPAALKSCIRNADTERLNRSAHTELIYVPQMWALVMGLDHMLTVGPISCEALLTSALVLNDNSRVNKGHKCTFVQICFLNDSMLEEVTYPRDQCASWFGLLNKHHEIRSVLPQGKREPSSKSYPLLVGDQMLSDVTWASIQRASSEPVLRLWMEIPKLPKVKVRHVDGGSDPQEQQINDIEEDVSEQPGFTSSNTGARFEELGRIPVVKAFLGWRVMDDYGDVNDCAVDVQAQRFLDDIYELLAAKCVDDPRVPRHLPAQGRPSTVAKRGPTPKLDIHGKTLEDVREMLSTAPATEK